MDQNEGEVNKKGEKKNQQGQYPAILIKQARSIQDSLYGQKMTFSCGINMGDPEWVR